MWTPPEEWKACLLYSPKDNLNLGIKTEPITAGADATVYVCLLWTYILYGLYGCYYIRIKIQTYTIAQAPHCPKNYQNLYSLSRLEQMQQLMFVFCSHIYLAQKPDIYRCICTNRDRLDFYSEIQIIFGTAVTGPIYMRKFRYIIGTVYYYIRYSVKCAAIT